ncbi:MAG: phytanoyl-CoA dioxygenase family protein, partial [Actinobacteria bacterium]|nr:phytanoyl-CoA dioxygenase family protein [Actinomycetota bacterium]
MTTAPATRPALHPWNDGFAWIPRRGPFRVLTPAQAEQFDRDGFVVVPDVFSPTEIAEVLNEIDEAEAAVEAMLRDVDDERLFIAEAG